MNTIKSLVLGSAAALAVLGTAQAADLPVKAKAVEYVKVCSLYGAGFYYIPGTDTCIKIGGQIRADVTFNGIGAHNEPGWRGASGAGTRDRNDYIGRSRFGFNLDTRTATEYGVVRTYSEIYQQWTTGTDSVAGGSLGVYFAFVQFAGFTFGKAVSQFSTPWNGTPGNNTSYLLGGEDNATGINQIAYTAQFGNGMSASFSLEDPVGHDRKVLLNTFNMTGAANAASGAFTDNYGGFVAPDIVGQFRIDQAWGLFQISAAAHNIHARYYGTNELSGHPSDAWGFAVLAGLSLKNLPTGKGDTINVDATYANGASRYVFGGTTNAASNFAVFGGGSGLGAYQSLGIATIADGIYGPGGGIEKNTAWGVRGAYTHNWNPYWSTSIFGAYSRLEYSGNGAALYCAAYGALTGAKSANYSCNPNFSLPQVGAVVRWTPVRGLAFSAEVMYSRLEQNFTGSAVLSPGGYKPTAVYEYKNQDIISGGVRVQRNF